MSMKMQFTQASSLSGLLGMHTSNCNIGLNSFTLVVHYIQTIQNLGVILILFT